MAQPEVIGHRGACGYRPELTASAIRLALELGATAVEVDLVPSRDGVLVVRHEHELSGTTDIASRPEFADRAKRMRVAGIPRRGWSSTDFTWAELAALRARERLPRLRPGSATHDGEEGILTLEGALAITREFGARLVLELKHPAKFAAQGLGFPELLLPELRRLGATPAEVAVETFEHAALRELAARGVDVPLVGLIITRRNPSGDPMATSAAFRDLRALEDLAGISVPLSLARPRLVERAADVGLTTWTWTLRPENRFLPSRYRVRGGAALFGHYRRYWRDVASSGVAAVFADHPDLAIAALHHDARTAPIGVVRS